MQVTVNQDNISMEFTITIPLGTIEKEVDKQLKEAEKSVNIPGFRKNSSLKLRYLRKQHGERIRADIIQRYRETEWLRKACEQENATPITPPVIDDITNELDKDYVFSAKFEVEPEFELIDFSDKSFEKAVGKIEDLDVEKALKEMRREHASWELTEEPAKEGDRVGIALETKDQNGEIVEELCTIGEAPYPFTATINSGGAIPGLRAQLIGLKAGDKHSVELTMPKNFAQEPKYSGQTLVFNIEVKEVNHPILPALDDAFAQELLEEDSTVHDLRDAVREQLTATLDELLLDKQMELLRITMAKWHADIALPQMLYRQYLINAFSYQFFEKGLVDLETIELSQLEDLLTAEETASVRDEIRGDLVLSKIIRTAELKVEQKDVYENLVNMAQKFQNPEAALKRLAAQQDTVAKAQKNAWNRAVLKHLLETIEHQEKTYRYSELMQNP